MYREEMTINFKDLARRCLEKWKFLLICMLIGAVLVDCLGALHSEKKAREAMVLIEKEKNKESETENLITLKEYMSKLSEREISEVQTAFSSYKSYQTEYINGLTYCQESVRMQLDPTKVPTLRLGYIIDNHYETTYPVISKRDTTDAIINTLAEQICNDEVSQQIADAIGLAENTAYVQELVTSEKKDDDMLIINIISKDKENCQKIAEIIKQTINEQCASVHMACGDFDIVLAAEQYMEKTDTQLMSEKQNRMIALNNLKNAINNLTAGMTEEQVTYYNALRDNENNIVLKVPETEKITDEAEEQEIVVPAVKYVSIKWIIVGFILGWLSGLVCIMFRYFFASTLRVVADMEDIMELTVLGEVTDKSKRKLPIFKNRFDDFDTEKQLQMAAAKISTVVEKETINRVFIGGTCETKRMYEVCEKISSLLEMKGIVCSIGASLLYDADVVKKMAAVDAAILVEQIDVSRYEEIENAKQLSKKCHVPIIGCVVLE